MNLKNFKILNEKYIGKSNTLLIASNLNKTLIISIKLFVTNVEI